MKMTDFTLTTNEVENADVMNTRHFLLKPEDVSPLEAYLVLKEIFGEPNNEYDEDKSEWSYLLSAQGSYVEVYDWKLESWSIAVYSGDNDQSTAKKIGDSFHHEIRTKAQKIKGKVKECVSNPSGYVIQNPYNLYYESANELLELLNSDDISPELLKKVPISDRILFFKYRNSESYVCRAAFLLYIASFEGLLNLVYELYLNSSLRDSRIYERLSREQIDMKLRLAPVYCECFKDNPIDHTTEEFKRFHSLINLRNDFVHANLTKSMRSPIVVEDGFRFIVPTTAAESKELPRNFSDLDIAHLETVKEILDGMVERLIEHMRPRFRKEFKFIMENDYIEVEYEDGIMVIV